MAFLSPGLSSRDNSFSIADDHMGSDHFPIHISLDKPLKQNTPLTEPRYRFDKTNDDLLHNTLKDSLNNVDTDITTQDELEELGVTLCDKLMNAVNTSTPKTYSRNDRKSPISQVILDLIKEKLRLRRLYHITQNTNTKSTINKLQKEIKTKINQESTISWEKVCNSISLEAHSYHFTPIDSLNDNVTDTDDGSTLVADVDPDTLIRKVHSKLKSGKVPGINNVYNGILTKAIGEGYIHFWLEPLPYH